jgi:hypothetical protein
MDDAVGRSPDEQELKQLVSKHGAGQS